VNKNSSSVFLFLIGLFSWTRITIVGRIGIAEFVCLFAGPVLFLKDYNDLRRHGLLPMCWLWILVSIGCLISSAYNHCTFSQWIRGVATPLTTFGLTVVIYHLLRNNLDGFRWLILGWSLTGIFTFVVNGASFTALLSEEGHIGSNESAVMRMYLFAPLVLIPTRCWYTKIPIWLSFGLLMFYGLYTLTASVSGRSASLIIIAGALLILIGGKSINRMISLRKHVGVLLIGAIAFAFAAKFGYSKAATAGMLGERARIKYEQQTHGKDSMLALLMGGRIQFFAGAYAAMLQPIVGYGPWPIDKMGVYEDFLGKYGDYEDVRIYVENLNRNGGVGEIPTHSHIVGFWVWYGVCGLILWLYVLYIIFQFFRKYIDVMPQWYGMFATLIPALLWSIFFSPFGERTETAGMIVAILLTRAISAGKLQMGISDIMERRKYLP